MLITKKCGICAKEFTNRRKNGYLLSPNQFIKQNFCSLKCSGIHQIGVSKGKHTEEWKKNMSERLKREHALGLRKGIFTKAVRKKMSQSAKNKPPMTEETRRKIGEAHRGERSSQWKGNNVGYYGLHSWIQKELGKPTICFNCGTKEARKYEWANISHNYLRLISDWIRLCTRCHRNYDYGKIKIAFNFSSSKTGVY